MRKKSNRGIDAMHTPTARAKARATFKRNRAAKKKAAAHAHEVDTMQSVQDRLSAQAPPAAVPHKAKIDGIKLGIVRDLLAIITRVLS